MMPDDLKSPALFTASREVKGLLNDLALAGVIEVRRSLTFEEMQTIYAPRLDAILRALGRKRRRKCGEPK